MTQKVLRDLESRLVSSGGVRHAGLDPEGLLFHGLQSMESFDGLEIEAIAKQFREEHPDWDPAEPFNGEVLARHTTLARINENAAKWTLMNICSVQSQCQASGVIDANGNGAGEFGTFGELTGAVPLRDSKEPIATPFSPELLPEAFGRVQEGRVIFSGYVFQMWLPRSDDGTYSPESANGGIDAESVDASQAELCFLCYAWPVEAGKSGGRAFAVNQSGTVVFCENPLSWSGLGNSPPVDAALSREHWTLAVNSESVRGAEWRACY